MVKAHPPLATRERLLAAALAEFAARGFDGAKVDRIARRARANKAMLYYHFRSKAALYLEILRTEFGAVGDAVAAVRARGGAPEDQLARFVAAVAEETSARPSLPPIWLREVAEGGRHLDETVVAALRRILETLSAILADGRRSGCFGPVNPFVTQIGIVAPLLFFAASAPLRERLRHLMPTASAPPQLRDVLVHVQAATLAGVRDASRRRPRAARSLRTRRRVS